MYMEHRTTATTSCCCCCHFLHCSLSTFRGNVCVRESMYVYLEVLSCVLPFCVWAGKLAERMALFFFILFFAIARTGGSGAFLWLFLLSEVLYVRVPFVLESRISGKGGETTARFTCEAGPLWKRTQHGTPSPAGEVGVRRVRRALLP
ncbi:hypothetical protein LZ32DRAFT_455420 [Colletotrichum eremochloae]|nr:hypothetical protein LZ32DRAFT_455420 [Colletotrichum eremochloae]